ncbi:MAG: N-acetylmuramate alpha-1-phosphate uridylyltransferase MurU [Pseudomonadota bacterium]
MPRVHPRTAMILAAGRGTRMRSLTAHTPKPLLMVGDRSLIEWQITRLVAAKIRRIVINHAWLGEQIVRALGDGTRWGVQITYSAEPPAAGLETGGGIRQALPLLGDQPFLVVNADVWFDLALGQLSLPAGDLAHLILVPNPTHHPHGDFHLTSDGRVTCQSSPMLTYSGIGVYHHDLFRNLPTGTYPLAPILQQAAETGTLSGTLYTGNWMDIGTPERLTKLRQRLTTH